MVGVPQGLSHLRLSVTVAEEIGKSSRHSNRSGKVQSLVAIKGRPTARGGCGRGWEAGFQGLGIISLPEARSEAQVVRPVRLKTCRQTAQLWGTQATGESVEAAKVFLTSMWLNAEGALWVAGNRGPGREQAHIQTSVLACDHVAWLSSHTSLGLC